MSRIPILSMIALCFLLARSTFAINTESVSPIFRAGINDVKVIGDYAFCTDAEGLIVLDIADPAKPVPAGNWQIQGGAFEIFIDGRYALITGWQSGLQIIDIADPAKPSLAGSYDLPNYACGIHVSGDYAYIANGYAGLQIIDISNPANPILTGNYDTPGYAFDLFVAGDYAYIADMNSGLQIVDISDPASPVRAGNYSDPEYISDIFIAGSQAFIAAGSAGFQILDIADPAGPRFLGRYEDCNPEGMFVDDNVAYIADGKIKSGLLAVDITDPMQPTLSNRLDTPGWDKNIYVDGNYAYTANYYGLNIINITNPSSLRLIGNYQTTPAKKTYEAENYIYISDDDRPLITQYLRDAKDFVLRDNYGYIAGRSGETSWHCCLLKSDTNGVEQWFHEYGPFSIYDLALAITGTNDDGFALAGKVQPVAGVSQDDILIAKTDSFGDTLWHQEHDLSGTAWNGNGFDRLWDILELDDGYLVGCGTITDRSQAFDPLIYPNSHKDAGLLKFNSLGEIEWVQSYGTTTSTESARALKHTSDGGFLLAGFSEYYYSNKNLLYVIKTDSAGNVEWERAYGDSTKWHDARWVEETSDGNYLVAGEIVVDQGIDGLIAKISAADGDIIWQHAFGDQYVDAFRDGLITAAEDILIAGFTNSDNEDFSDAWVVKLDSAGNYICEIKQGFTDSTEHFIGIDGPIGNNYILAGNKSDLTDMFLTMSDLSSCEPMMFHYLPGDANMINAAWPPSVIGSDATYMIGYFRGAPASLPCYLNGFWASADANGDCQVIGSDVTRIINYLRGTGSIEWCPDHKPFWRTSGDLPAEAPAGWPNCE